MLYFFYFFPAENLLVLRSRDLGKPGGQLCDELTRSLPSLGKQVSRQTGDMQGGPSGDAMSRCHQDLEPRKATPEPGHTAGGTQPPPRSPAATCPAHTGDSDTAPGDTGAAPLCHPLVTNGQTILASGSLQHDLGFAQPLFLSPGLPWRFGTSVGTGNGSVTSTGCPCPG